MNLATYVLISWYEFHLVSYLHAANYVVSMHSSKFCLFFTKWIDTIFLQEYPDKILLNCYSLNLNVAVRHFTDEISKLI